MVRPDGEAGVSASSGLPLDDRQVRILHHLLRHPEPSSVPAMGNALRLPDHVIRYNLETLRPFIEHLGLRLSRRRGVGFWIEGEPAARANLASSLARTVVSALVPSERRTVALLTLLDRAPGAAHLDEIEAEIGASRPTARRDVQVAERWLADHRLLLDRSRDGLAVRGQEVDIRRAIVALLADVLPADRLQVMIADPHGAADFQAALPAELRRYLAGLDLHTCHAALAPELGDVSDLDRMVERVTLHLAVMTRRLRAGREARLELGRLRSLADHPVAEAAGRIVGRLEERFGVTFAPADVATVTEYLLGFVELADSGVGGNAGDEAIVDRIITLAATHLHASLTEDDVLRRSLVDHIRRLRVRLRYGLPVSNPLRDEVRARYPDVYAVAEELMDDLDTDGGATLPADEVGFLTMYLAGALERSRLRPKPRIVVVCPAGMATAWILVSRLAAEFPHVEIERVISKSTFEGADSEPIADLVVSTVPLSVRASRPIVIVSPLLPERDVRRVGRALGYPIA
jgi:transcriptional antiterminator